MCVCVCLNAMFCLSRLFILLAKIALSEPPSLETGSCASAHLGIRAPDYLNTEKDNCSLGVSLPPREGLAISGDTLVVATGEGDWHLVGLVGMLLS